MGPFVLAEAFHSALLPFPGGGQGSLAKTSVRRDKVPTIPARKAIDAMNLLLCLRMLHHNSPEKPERSVEHRVDAAEVLALGTEYGRKKVGGILAVWTYGFGKMAVVSFAMSPSLMGAASQPYKASGP